MFLDRDGVLNALVQRDGGWFSPQELSQFRLYPSTAWFLRELNDFGARVVVVTNQPDISRGRMLWKDLVAMNALLLQAGVHDISVCPHSDNDQCLCRKPLPGLLKAHLHDALYRRVWMVGDRDVDIAAGTAVGARTIRIEMQSVSFPARIGADLTCKSHIEVIKAICES